MKNILFESILEEIENFGGYITVKQFIQLALYHHELGYYSSDYATIGKNGDFYTNISIGSLYGKILLSLCYEVWQILNCPNPFIIMEEGSNDGLLIHDILETAIEDYSNNFFDTLQFFIVEPFTRSEEKQKQTLASFHHKVTWFKNIKDIPEFIGIHLSNEFIDALPVHSCCFFQKKWREQIVIFKKNRLILDIRDLDPALEIEIQNYFPDYLVEGYCVEYRPQIKQWLALLSQKIKKGIILITDYGEFGSNRYLPHRADGTIRAYRQHQLSHHYLLDPGLQDITSDVDFTYLVDQAKIIGWNILGFSYQEHFLLGIVEEWLKKISDFSTDNRQQLRSLQTLIHPHFMGMRFKTLLLEKNLPVTKQQLSCLKFQRPGIDVFT